jgi:N-acetylglucosaminyl-diphospho-decaprenol L-rhamnosyltransferase
MFESAALPPLVSVIVVSWNTRGYLGACLQSVYDSIPQPEVIVVDNGSSDDSVESVSAQFPAAQLIVNRENVGFARANNQAFELCTGKYILLLNSDAILAPGTVDVLMRVLEENSNTAAVGPMILNADSTFQAGGTDFPNLVSETLLALGMARWLRRGYYPGYPPEEPGGLVDWVGGACLLLRRSVIEQIGGLDTNYFMYTEETDWCFRAHAAGWQVRYDPSPHIIHYGGASSRQAAAAMKSELYRSKLLFFRRHRPYWQFKSLQAIIVASATCKAWLFAFAAQLTQSRRESYQRQAISFRQVSRACR